MKKLSWLVLSVAASSAGIGAANGCGGDNDSAGAPTDGGSGEAATPSGTSDGGSTPSPGPGVDGGSSPESVSFAFKPGWTGVKKVEVVGGFGQASDWDKKTSFLTLADDGSGNFVGSSQLSIGHYSYVFRITGDSAASTPDTYVRYAVDAKNSAIVACPAASPTFSKADPNPCSDLGVPAPAASSAHVKGSLAVDGAPASGWLVVLEREEAKSHHFFVNRTTAGADGSFDLLAAPGMYRLQVQHPTTLNTSDLARDPVALATLRRAISSAFPLATADVTVTAPDLAFHSYSAFGPVEDGGTLPTQFTFEGGGQAVLDVYGGAADGGIVEIGDPWFAGPQTTDGGAEFDGRFATKAANQDAAVPGTRYLWGTEEAVDASVRWTKQSMVFPITWH